LTARGGFGRVGGTLMDNALPRPFGFFFYYFGEVRPAL